MNILIKEIVEEIVEKFGKDIKTIKYQFVESGDTHFLEIIPGSVLHSSGFVDTAYACINKFMDADVGGILSFLNEDSLTKLDKPFVVYSKGHIKIMDDLGYGIIGNPHKSPAVKHLIDNLNKIGNKKLATKSLSILQKFGDGINALDKLESHRTFYLKLSHDNMIRYIDESNFPIHIKSFMLNIIYAKFTVKNKRFRKMEINELKIKKHPKK